ncbi:NnrU protein [Rhodobacteraceae bacterium THAF1]|uniref:NnrU family protein n=1 Tax=Palleronia sp. THAF1 TaxID=2587842 RepID=UPI000F3B7554|nr:NnrU family protein [Palleronia sp. THAF1]QFU07855.1 NnrU protein [Palleronia sp. THAF1]VDC25689.1 NnrU protein [Rhodobacteraceae bacterium THAF1]
MIVLILGVALWVGAHLFKRLAPDARARLGKPGKGALALAIVVSIVLMVIGYRMADGAVFWGRSPAMVGINNLLMVVAFYIYASGMAKSRRNWVGHKLRHPQLIGFSLWAFAHLLVNGDVPSFILFGGLLIWALAEMTLINRAQPDWTPVPYGGKKKEISVAVITVVIVVIVMLIHNWLGVQPWG